MAQTWPLIIHPVKNIINETKHLNKKRYDARTQTGLWKKLSQLIVKKIMPWKAQDEASLWTIEWNYNNPHQNCKHDNQYGSNWLLTSICYPLLPIRIGWKLKFTMERHSYNFTDPISCIKRTKEIWKRRCWRRPRWSKTTTQENNAGSKGCNKNDYRIKKL